ncbi:MAG: hypothetical protein ACMUIE_10355, partial [Thermoplasmatota archaeon]
RKDTFFEEGTIAHLPFAEPFCPELRKAAVDTAAEMKYKVHRLEVKSKEMQEKLEKFINTLNGEIISIIPNVKPTFQPMGATAKIDYLLIVEKIG